VGPLRTSSRRRAPARLLLTALAVAAAAVPAVAPQAHGKKSIEGLKARLDELQQQLDAATAHVEDLRTEENQLRFAVAMKDEEIRKIQLRRSALQERAAAAAKRIYMAGGVDTLEVLLSSDSLSELASRSQALAYVSEFESNALAEFAATEARLAELQKDLLSKADLSTATRARLDSKTDELQANFNEIADEYNRLKRQLAAQARQAARAVGGGTVVFSANGMACPIAAPNSFIDSWHFPRDGGARLHEGTDMMAAMGAPVVAITDGRITFAGVGTSAGNWIVLAGDDGHSYWYMHNQVNLVTSGHVSAGQLIAKVGDTGNALGGPPHVHFEYHPNMGGPVNPYPLLAEVCRGAAR
jgi:peptidoglycan LD-endopeptidase LytH